MFFIASQRSCGKVMFLHLSLILFTGGLCLGEGGLCPGGGSVQGWSLSGGISVHGVSARETPVQLRAGGVHPTGMHSSCNIYCTTDQTW